MTAKKRKSVLTIFMPNFFPSEKNHNKKEIVAQDPGRRLIPSCAIAENSPLSTTRFFRAMMARTNRSKRSSMPLPFRRRKRETPPEERISSSGSAILAFVFELIQVAAVSLAIIIPVRYFLIQPFYVKGASMEPSFFDHEYLIIDELSYRFNDPARGDIVVFRYPPDPKQYFIKRVVGLPGETVEVTEEGVKIYDNEHPNGFVLDEDVYLEEDRKASPTKKTLTLKSGEYFMMGDNRPSSLDSRYFGPVTRSNIVGRVWLRGWPFDRWKVFERPEYSVE
jgi:signal peptidase I